MYYHQKHFDRDDENNDLGVNAYIVVDHYNFDVVGEYMTLEEAIENAYDMNVEKLTEYLQSVHGLKEFHSRDGNISQCGRYYMEHFFINDFCGDTIEEILNNPSKFCMKLKEELKQKHLKVTSISHCIGDNIDSFIEIRLKHSNKLSFEQGIKNRESEKKKTGLNYIKN